MPSTNCNTNRSVLTSNPSQATYFKEITFPLPLIQAGQLSVTNESMHTLSTCKLLK